MSNPQSTVHSPQSNKAWFVNRRVFLIFCLLPSAFCLLITGCIRRSLTIRSEPPGAELIVNDKHLGTTPQSYDFQWYGWYRITLMKDGYERLDDRVLINAPFYFWIPLDLVMELLPLRMRDDQVLSYELTPRQPLPEPIPPPVVGEPTSTQQEESPATEEATSNGQDR